MKSWSASKVMRRAQRKNGSHKSLEGTVQTDVCHADRRAARIGPGTMDCIESLPSHTSRAASRGTEPR